MKTLRYLIIYFLLLQPFFFVSAQEKKARLTIAGDYYPYAKGNNNFTLTQNMEYTRYKHSANGQSNGHTNTLDLNLNWNYFPWQNMGVGLDIDINRQGYHNNNTEQLTRDFMTYANFKYGGPISKNINYFFQVGAGIGSHKEIYKNSSITQENTSNLTGFKVITGFPIEMCNRGNVCLTPNIGYRYLREKADNETQKDSRFWGGLKLESYLGCDDFGCDCKKGFYKGMHDQGRSFIGFTTMAKGAFGNSEYEVTGLPTTQEDKNTDFRLSGDYVYYAAKNFGIGSGISAWNTVQKSKANDIRYSWSGITIMPEVIINAPVNNVWNNSFLRLRYEIGSQKTEYKVGSNTTTFKANTSGFSAGVGYDWFVSKKLSLSPILGYRSASIKEKDTDDKDTDKGFFYEFGARTFF